MNKPTKYTRENNYRNSSNNRNKGRGLPVQKDQVVIDAAEYEDNPVVELVCPKCNFILQMRLTGGDTIVCYYCQREIKLGETQTISAIEDPNKTTIKPDIVSIDYDYERDVTITKQPEPKGTFAEMQKKGIRITSYQEGVGW